MELNQLKAAQSRNESTGEQSHSFTLKDHQPSPSDAVFKKLSTFTLLSRTYRGKNERIFEVANNNNSSDDSAEKAKN